MSRTAKIYIGLIIAGGAAALVHGLFSWSPHDLPRFFCYLLLAIPASCLKVVLPGITGTMSVLFVFLLAGIVELGLGETLIIGVLCVVIQSFWHAKKRPRFVQLAFSVAEIALAISSSYFAYHTLISLAPTVATPFRLALAASVFFLTNTFPVAVVIALTEEKSLREIWSSCYFWSFSYYLAGAAVVGVFSFANRVFDWQVSILILPVVYVMYRSYNLYLDQLQSERKYASEVAALQKRTAEALASAMSANAKLDAAIQSSPLAILAVDRQGNVMSWNTMAESILGWSAEETIGRPLPFMGGRSEDVVPEIIARAFRGELVSGTEITQWRKDGSPFQSAIWTAPMRDGAEEISAILITVADISDKERLEAQLRLSQKMEAVGRLAGGIAHDFNNLLTVINGYSAMLVDSLKDNPYAASQAEGILTAGNRAAELVSQLLTFSRRQMIKPRPIQVEQLVQGVERMLRRVIGEHIEFRTNLDPDAGWIRGDVNQMESVLLNLANNAQDAMPHGGILSIETTRLEVTPDHLTPLPDLPCGSYVLLAVSDTGHGMDAETQRHIFEPFFTTKQTGKGTGLGLSSVYGSVEQSGGRIFVASQIGKGTTFSIYLPRIDPAPSVNTPPPAPDLCRQGTETILLVEDEGGVRRMLREVFSTAGYTVWEAGNGAEAIERWAAKIDKVDLLVTDIVMPVMNGLKLAEELRKMRADLQVVYLSGHSEQMIKGQTGPDPASDVLQKPFVPDVLVRKVREILKESGKSNLSATAPFLPNR